MLPLGNRSQDFFLKEHIEELLIQALLAPDTRWRLNADCDIAPQLERTRSPEHGEFASNIAMVLAKRTGKPPRELAQIIIDKMPRSRQVSHAEIAGPGFINFYMNQVALTTVVKDILYQGDNYGHVPPNPKHEVTVEFVSANPTGPLHVGHGRGAAYGASLASILQASGYPVQREYYVNDNGRQMDILAVSVWLRYLELCGEQLRFPENGYRGDYIYNIAREVRKEIGDKWRFKGQDVTDGLPPDESDGGTGKSILMHFIDRARELLGHAGYQAFFETSVNSILTDIQKDLSGFGVIFDHWFSEKELEDSGAIEHAIERLEENGHLYKKDGATWFRASELGDEKDRVIIRENGRTTYFASDIAYFLNKMERGFEKALYIFGADHHGYIARLRAAALDWVKTRTALKYCWFSLPCFTVMARKSPCLRAPVSSSPCGSCARKLAVMQPGSFTSCAHMSSIWILISTWPNHEAMKTRCITSSMHMREFAVYSETSNKWMKHTTRPSARPH